MRNLRVAVTVLLLLVGAAVLVDRLALLCWRIRVERYANALAEAAQQPDAQPSFRSLLMTTTDAGTARVPFVQVRVKGPKPSGIAVDGNGGLNLWYEPPLFAWSRHIGLSQQRPVIQGSDVYSYNDVYILKIWTVEARPGGKVLNRPSVKLEHGLPF